MKNKKTQIFVVIGIIAVLLAGIIAFVISRLIPFGQILEANLPEDSQVVADDNPFLLDVGYSKPEIAVDGVLDDAQWKDLKAITYKGKHTTKVKGFYGEAGLYIGAEIEDKDLWSGKTNPWDNSCFELYFDTLNAGGSAPSVTCWELFVDIGEKSRTMVGNGVTFADSDLLKSYAVKVNGTTNDDVEDKGYSVEIYIPYSQLGGVPEVDYGIALGTVTCNQGMRDGWIGIQNCNPKIPDSYYILERGTNEIKKPNKVNTAKYKIDGKDDDSIWNDRTTFVFGNNRRASVSNYFAKEGLYLFYEVTDQKVISDDDVVWKNDSAEVYLDTLSNGGLKPQLDDYQIRVDTNNKVEVLRGNGTTWKEYKDNVITAIRKTKSGYNVEMFVAWSDLGLTKMPESMKVNFGTVDWNGEFDDKGNHIKAWSGIENSVHIPDAYMRMTKNNIEPPEQLGALVVTKPKAPKSEVKLDGVLDDKLWKNAKVFLYSGMSVKVKYVWTNKGCYMGFEVTDDLVDTERYTPWTNSSVEIYLDYENNNGKPGDKDRQIMVDASGRLYVKKGDKDVWKSFIGTAIQSAASQTETGYIVELYIPWAEFGGNRPKTMGVAFGHVLLTNVTTRARRWIGDELCADPQKPALYSDFTATKITDVAN